MKNFYYTSSCCMGFISSIGEFMKFPTDDEYYEYLEEDTNE